MKLDTFSMQVTVPQSKYGPCTYFMPDVLQDWLKSQGLRGSYCSGQSWGDGYTNGVTNKTSVYMVGGIKDRETCLLFAILFPECQLHVGNEHSYD